MGATEKSNLLIIDPCPLLADALKIAIKQSALLSSRIVDIFAVYSAADLEAFLAEHEIDMIIMDHLVAGNEEGRLIKWFRQKFGAIRILVFSHYPNQQDFKDALKNRADGFALKTSTWEVFESYIVRVLKGEIVMGEGVSIGNIGNPATPPTSNNPNTHPDKQYIKNQLTKREIEILHLLAEAKSNKEIGKMLFISDKTVVVHRKNIMRKFNVNSILQLIKSANEIGLVDI